MKTTLSIIAAIAALTGASQAALFADDFSSDTSGDYTGTVTFGSNGTGDAGIGHTVHDGFLDLDSWETTSRTYSVFHSTAGLEVGETFSVDFLIHGSTANDNNSSDMRISINGKAAVGPNFDSGRGIRILKTASSFQTSTYGGAGTTPGETIAVSYTGAINMFITRLTPDTFSYGFDDNEVGSVLTINGVASDTALFVGVEAFGRSERRFDNFEVAVPEPSSAALLGLGGLALILRRRK